MTGSWDNGYTLHSAYNGKYVQLNSIISKRLIRRPHCSACTIMMLLGGEETRGSFLSDLFFMRPSIYQTLIPPPNISDQLHAPFKTRRKLSTVRSSLISTIRLRPLGLILIPGKTSPSRLWSSYFLLPSGL